MRNPKEKQMKPNPAFRFSGITVLAAAIALVLLSCVNRSKGPSLADVQKMPYKQASAYSADIPATLAKDAPQRIAEAPAVLLEYLRQVDGNPGYASYSPTEAERALFAQYYALLPARFHDAMATKVLGVYFIQGFAGGGMSDFVFTADGSMKLILVLNPKTLSMSLPDWIGYRDNSTYADDGKDIKLVASCPGGAKYRGLIHTLTHEAAHIYDYSNAVTPYVEKHLSQGSSTADAKDFTRSVWKSYAQPIAAYAIPDREKLAPYGLGAALPLSTALPQYAALAKTPFYSLYGSASWAEDFAEAAAWTHLRDKLGIGYEVSLLRSGREESLFVPGLVPGTDARQAALRGSLH
jgi:hypothetical protein